MKVKDRSECDDAGMGRVEAPRPAPGAVARTQQLTAPSAADDAPGPAPMGIAVASEPREMGELVPMPEGQFVDGLVSGAASPQPRAVQRKKRKRVADQGDSDGGDEDRGDGASAAMPAHVAFASPLTELAYHAKDVVDAVELAGLAMATKRLPDADLVRLGDAIARLADHLHTHAGARGPADEAALRTAVQGAERFINRLEPRHRRQQDELRERLGRVRQVLQENTAREATLESPGALLGKVESIEATLSRWQAFAAAYQPPSQPPPTGFERWKVLDQRSAGAQGLTTDGVDDALATARSWIARVKEGPRDAEALARAIVDQYEVVTMASAELRQVLEQPVTPTTQGVLEAYLHVLAISGGRRAQSDAALEVARAWRRRIPLDRAAAALEQSGAQTHHLNELDPAAGRSAQAEQDELSRQHGALAQRIAEGDVVDRGELDAFVLETREHEFLNRVDVLRVDAKRLLDAVGSLGGARTPPGVKVRGKLSDLMADMAGVRRRYQEFAFAVGGEPAAKARARKEETLRFMEAQLKDALASGQYELTLKEAEQVFDDLVVRRMVTQLTWTIALTVAGNFLASAVRGAGEAVLIESGVSLANAARLAQVVAYGSEATFGAATQKGILGDEASFGTLLAVNLLTPLAVDRVMAVGRSAERAADGAADMAVRSERLLEAGASTAGGAVDDVVSAAARFDRAAKRSVWVRNTQRGGLALRSGARLTAEMVVGAAVDYATRMAAGSAQGRSPDEQTAGEWLMQGASIAIGRHLSGNVKAVRSRLRAVESGSGAAVRSLLGDADSVAKDALLLESGDPSVDATDVVERYGTLLSEELALLERELAATVDGQGGHSEKKLMALLAGNQRSSGELRTLASGEAQGEDGAGGAPAARAPRPRAGRDGGDDAPPPAKDEDGDDFDPRWLTQGQERVRDWQLQGLEGDPGGQAMLADREFRVWFERWMSMPDRVTFGDKGAVARYPEGTPPHVRVKLGRAAHAGGLIDMSRAVDLGEQLRAEFPDVEMDPTSASWLAARSKIVERVGERSVVQYEERFAGEATVGGAPGIRRIERLIEPEMLGKFVSMFPGSDVYVSGKAAEDVSLHQVTGIEMTIVVPDGTSVAVRAEFEGNANRMTLRASNDDGPGSYADDVRRANVRGNVPLIDQFPVRARVMTRSEFAGHSMATLSVARSGGATEIRVDAPGTGDTPGRGDTGVDLHNHIMGVLEATYFIDRLGKGNAAAALDRTWQIVNDERFWKPDPQNGAKVREVKNTIMAVLAEARSDIGYLRDRVPPTAVEARARRALEAVLAASESVPFDHTYDLRDLLVQAAIDPGGASFRNFATDTVRALHEQGVTYSEQSVSIKKLDTRFDEATMREVHATLAAEGKDSDLRFLAMLSTKEVLSGEPLQPEMQAKLDRVLARADVMGLDIAGPEAQAFTQGGVQNLARLIKLLKAAAAKRGRPLVLRPHVGEGYDPAGSGAHVALARDNLEKTLNALTLADYQGPGDGVIVRFGHAAHATPEQLQLIAEFGIVVESNVGSNLATGAVVAASDHPLLLNLYYGVDTMLATDAQGVMETTLSVEYQRAAQLIGMFQAGKTRLLLDGKEVSFDELPPDVQGRFSLETLEETARAYVERQRGDDARDRTRPGRPRARNPG